MCVCVCFGVCGCVCFGVYVCLYCVLGDFFARASCRPVFLKGMFPDPLPLCDLLTDTQVMEVCGQPPPELLKRSPKVDKFFFKTNDSRYVPLMVCSLF